MKRLTSPPAVRDRWTPVRRHLLVPLLDRWYGRRTRVYIPDVARRLALPRDAMQHHRLEALRGLLQHAYATSPLHRERMQAAAFDPAAFDDPAALSELPMLTRHDVGGRPADLLSNVHRPGALIEAHSGGTTSTPVPFMQPQAAIWRKNAAAVVLRRMIGWHEGDRLGMLWGAVEDLPEPPRGLLRRLKAGVFGAIEQVLSLPAPDLCDEKLDTFIDAIRRYRPVVIQAYPSAADLLARRVLAAHAPLHVPIVLLTAEQVFAAQRERITHALHAAVYSFYGAREVGWIASECPHERSLHVNTDGIHLETGEDGRLLVTDLLNYAMPLIRYDIGDRGRLADVPCPCGDPRPVLAELHGRANDVFVLPSGRRIPGTVADIRNYMMEDGIVETQLVQVAPDRLLVRYVAAPSFREEHLEGLRSYIDASFLGEVEYEFERADRIEPEPNGKTRYCIAYAGDAS